MYSPKEIEKTLHEVEELISVAENAEEQHRVMLQHIHPAHELSARNLVHYLAIRAHDVRALQRSLSAMGISSISHCEAYTLNNLLKVRHILLALAGSGEQQVKISEPDADASAEMLKHNSEKLLGKMHFAGESKIMVTLPTEAGKDYELVRHLVKAGMHIARINTAHDDKDTWKAMIANVEKASEDTVRKVKIYMDIEGPKMRTGDIYVPGNNGQGDDKKQFIALQRGDRVGLVKVVTRQETMPVTALNIPELFDYVKKGASVWFDDGKLGGTVVSVGDGMIVVELNQVTEGGFKLKPAKGINFPDTDLHLPALTSDDLENLPFIAKHADMVGYSFVQTAEDVRNLQQHLAQLNRADIGVILKIETRLGFRNLPELLFAAMRQKHCGIMIARGDLAVEIGYSRMAEVQEEIMWIGEAAHLPVVWATQVLENLVKTGTATRAEISDAVKSVRAECVMLNKGPHIVAAIKMIRDIDKRMAAHEDKKRKILRPLHVAYDFMKSNVRETDILSKC